MRTNTRVEQLLALMREMVAVIEENGGVMKTDEAERETARRTGEYSSVMSYVGTSCVAEGWLELSFRQGTYSMPKKDQSIS